MPSSTRAIKPARTQAIIWPRVYTCPEDCHSDDDADPVPYGCDVIYKPLTCIFNYPPP